MQLIDTHAHIYSEKFEEDRDEMLQRAFDSGISSILMPNVDTDSIDGMLALEEKHAGKCFSMMGLHPCYVKENYQQELDTMYQWFSRRKFVAVGEIGLDFYWDLTFKEQQIDAFKKQLDWARELKLPVAIHMRDSIDETLEILEDYTDVEGVLHCFSGNIQQAKKAIQLKYSLGIGGVVTFKKSGLAEVIEEIPLDQIILETDSPYLAPTPNRGKRNEPSFITWVAEKISDIKEISAEEVARITTENAQQLFLSKV